MSEVAFLVGEAVTEIRFDNRIVFLSGEGPAPDLYADVGDYILSDAAGQTQPLASLVGQTVTASSTQDDVLTLEFSSGSTLRCEPQASYEAWQVVGGRPQYLVVCLPSGELAVWDERYVASREDAEEQARRVFGANWRVREITDRGGVILERGPSSED